MKRFPPGFWGVQAVWLLAPVLLAGCAVELGEAIPVEGDSEVATTANTIQGGTETLEHGVVRIRFANSAAPSCTGAMIGPNHIITAAHCLAPQFPGREGHFKATIFYFDPETGKRRITVDDQDEVLYGYYKETYQGQTSSWFGLIPGFDVESDVGIIFRAGSGSTPVPKRWRGTDDSDYLRLSLASCTQAKRNEFFGQGAVNDDGEGVGTLRTMPVIMEECHKHFFYSLEGSRGTCAGDSGGPYILTWGADNKRALVGVHSASENVSWFTPDICTVNGGEQHAMRMNDDKVNWIRSKTGHACPEYNVEDHRYVRCWDPLTPN